MTATDAARPTRMTSRLLDVAEVCETLDSRGYLIDRIELTSVRRPLVEVSPGAHCRELAGQRTAERGLDGHVRHFFETNLRGVRVVWKAA